MRKQIVLSDDMVELKRERIETLQYSLTLTGPIMFWKAEIIGPWSSDYHNLIGRASFATTSDNAVRRLKEQLERNGFIGQLVEHPIIEPMGERQYRDEKKIGRGPHRDLVDHDPLSD